MLVRVALARGTAGAARRCCYPAGGFCQRRCANQGLIHSQASASQIGCDHPTPLLVGGQPWRQLATTASAGERRRRQQPVGCGGCWRTGERGAQEGHAAVEGVLRGIYPVYQLMGAKALQHVRRQVYNTTRGAGELGSSPTAGVPTAGSSCHSLLHTAGGSPLLGLTAALSPVPRAASIAPAAPQVAAANSKCNNRLPEGLRRSLVSLLGPEDTGNHPERLPAALSELQGPPADGDRRYA